MPQKATLLVLHEYVKVYKFSTEDSADNLQCITAIMLGVIAAVMGSNTWVKNPLRCYMPVAETGQVFAQFVNTFCWTEGTIPLRPDEPLPTDEEGWSDYRRFRRISYYQWIPIILAVQSVCFFAPHWIWKTLSKYYATGNVSKLINFALTMSVKDKETRDAGVALVADFIHQRRKILESNRKQRTCCKGLLSKYTGYMLATSYLAVKILGLVNATLQLVLIQYYLGFYSQNTASVAWTSGEGLTSKFEYDESNGMQGFGLGISVAHHIATGQDWSKTLMFPRSAFCLVPGFQSVGAVNSYLAQCALPLNTVYEKLFIFIWFWMVLVIFVSSVDLLVWFLRLLIAPDKPICLMGARSTGSSSSVSSSGSSLRLKKQDCAPTLEIDERFLLRIVEANAGESFTDSVKEVLYASLRQKPKSS